jgi:dTDP-4-amino-4,6-dideoxygalactose transaminase
LARIYLSPPDVNGVDRQLLIEAVDWNWVAPVSPDLDAFEAAVAAQCGRRFGVGLVSGTAALHLALLELGVRPGDEVIVSSFTFSATANAVRYCGATPVLVDADENTWQVSVELVAEAIKSEEEPAPASPQPLWSTSMASALITTICSPSFARPPSQSSRTHVTEALGATYRGRPAGSFGDAAILSFNGDKIITTSGGGSLVTDEARLADRCRHLATQARAPAPHYEHAEVGFNYRPRTSLRHSVVASCRISGGESCAGGINRRYQDALAEVEDVASCLRLPTGRLPAGSHASRLIPRRSTCSGHPFAEALWESGPPEGVVLVRELR